MREPPTIAPLELIREASLDRRRRSGPDLGSSRDAQCRLDRRIVIVPPAHHLRGSVEDIIRETYRDAFGAHDLSFPHHLIAMTDDSGRPMCAAGLRTAAEGFFSEVYLGSPVETILTLRGGKPVTRGKVFEVTTLVSRTAGCAATFIRQLVVLGEIGGFDWSFFTATGQLRELLRRLEIRFVEIERADPARLSEAKKWGTYYRHLPVVCAVHRQWLDGASQSPSGVALDA